MTDATLERPDDLTAEWLTTALGGGSVESFTVDRIGTGVYKDGRTYWVTEIFLSTC